MCNIFSVSLPAEFSESEMFHPVLSVHILSLISCILQNKSKSIYPSRKKQSAKTAVFHLVCSAVCRKIVCCSKTRYNINVHMANKMKLYNQICFATSHWCMRREHVITVVCAAVLSVQMYNHSPKYNPVHPPPPLPNNSLHSLREPVFLSFILSLRPAGQSLIPRMSSPPHPTILWWARS